jgi:hypothetical protein
LVALSEKNLIEQVGYYTSKEERPRIIKKLTKIKFLERIAYILCHQQEATSTHVIVTFHKPESQSLPRGIIVY